MENQGEGTCMVQYCMAAAVDMHLVSGVSNINSLIAGFL